ncbi:MAG: AmmeMemoRadiSam system protein B [Thermoplasmatota archaeon]
MRSPAVAGMFYPGSRKPLQKEIERCYRDGPGSKEFKDGKVLGLVSPHAGYTYSGPVAAFGFGALRAGGMPDTVIVIGPNHRGMGSGAVACMDDFSTPLGVMRFDHDLGSLLGLRDDCRAHSQEHSMEVQLPFVQAADPGVKQVCISMSDQSLDSSVDLGKKISKALGKYTGSAAIIASSDFTHCGWNYGYPVPPGYNAGEFARSIDIPVIERLLDWDLPGAFRKRDSLGVTACGLGPVAAMMTAVSRSGGGKAVNLDYRTSYDVSPADSAVGYASIAVFEA